MDGAQPFAMEMQVLRRAFPAGTLAQDDGLFAGLSAA